MLRETKHDPDTYQYKNITFSKNFILEKINNNKYFIKSSAQNISGLLKISYNKNWKITSDDKIINGVIDKGGFIYIDHKNKSSKELLPIAEAILLDSSSNPSPPKSLNVDTRLKKRIVF